MKRRALLVTALLAAAAVLTTACGSLMTAPQTQSSAKDSYVMSESAAESYNGAASAPTAVYEAGEAMAAYDMYEEYDEYEYEEPYDPGYVGEMNTEEYSYRQENSFVTVEAHPFSTFAADVDTASYANMRRQLLKGGQIVPDSVRIEEMVNYFRYDYPEPETGEPFSVTTEIADCPWNPEAKLMLVGLQAMEPDLDEMPRSNLVFLIDVSGSMDDPAKLPLVQRSFLTLVENLDDRDVVSMVTYSSGERVVLDGVSASNRNEIMTAVESLQAYGSTNGEDALNTAYRLAEQNFIEGGNNRIIMATDGDFNVGISSEGELTRLVKDKAKNGVFLSVLGYGMGNYKDNKLESLADNGNGNYAYIDTIDEARKVLVSEAGGTLFTVAKDVKLQVEFNPERVQAYRLIGYENRKMSAQDFADDTKDGGEIGAGHQVTALYEIIPVGSEYEIDGVESRYSDKDKDKETKEESAYADEYCIVRIRYKEPDGDTSTLIEKLVTVDAERDEMSANLSWAAGVAQVGMLLKDSEYAGSSDFEEVKERLKAIADDDFRLEFVYLISKMK